MYRCPNCQTPLEVSALFSLISSRHARCSTCGHLYRWEFSPPILLLMLALVRTSAFGLMLTLQQISTGILLVGVAAIAAASAYLATCAVRPVIR